MKLIIALRVGVLHRNLRAEFSVGSDCLTELLVIGKIRRVRRCRVELVEPLSLLLRDPKVSVDSDQMVEAKLSGQAVGATEGSSREGGHMIDGLRLAGPEEWLAAPAGVYRGHREGYRADKFDGRRFTQSAPGEVVVEKQCGLVWRPRALEDRSEHANDDAAPVEAGEGVTGSLGACGRVQLVPIIRQPRRSRLLVGRPFGCPPPDTSE